MAQNDYAIVVGINSYPGLGGPPPSPADLNGPENDADAIAAWLALPQGGNVPPQNIKVIRSRDFPVTQDYFKAQPKTEAIEDEFGRLEMLAEKNSQAGLGKKVGRRLYIYVSGHGFSPSRFQGCLFTANATATQTKNVFVSGWLESFMDTLYFDEFVLWMDCCMDRQFTVVPGSVSLRKQGASGRPGPTFIAFAAPRPLKAAEHPIAADGNKVHGVFTWTLLEGLRGLGADPSTKKLTARSLADYLRNTLKTHLIQSELDDPDISQEPEIIKDDPTLIFAADVPQSGIQVTLNFPAEAVGKNLILHSTDGKTPIPNVPASIQIKLNTGLYVATLDTLPRMAGFEVGGQKTIVLDFKDRPAQPQSTAGVCTISISTNDAATEIVLVDSKFTLVDRQMRFLRKEVPPGVYKVRTKSGRSSSEEIVLLEGNLDLNLASPDVVSAAPLGDSSVRHEYHEEGMRSLRHAVPLLLGNGSEIALMVRVWSKSGSSSAQPWKGVKLLDANRSVLCDLSSEPPLHLDRDPFVIKRLQVTPGCYYLQQTFSNGPEWEQIVTASAGWSSTLFLLHIADQRGMLTPDPAIPGTLNEVRRSFFMSSLSDGFPRPQEESIVERARIALADERRILHPELEELLFRKFNNPIAGIIGALLMIAEAERDSAEDHDLASLNIIVPNLRKLVGHSHPDVEAISLRCPDPSLRTTQIISVPPIFFRSWKLLVEASAQRPELIPVALWDRICAATAAGGFLLWAVDQDTVAAQQKQWAEWVRKLTTSDESPRRGSSPRSGGLEAFRSAAAPTEDLDTFRQSATKAALAVGVPLAAFEKMWQKSPPK
jgi:hypothetical protein